MGVEVEALGLIDKNHLRMVDFGNAWNCKRRKSFLHQSRDNIQGVDIGFLKKGKAYGRWVEKQSSLPALWQNQGSGLIKFLII